MKRVTMFHYAAAAEGAGGAASAVVAFKPEPTSAKLVELQASRNAARLAYKGLPDTATEQEQDTALGNVLKIEAEIKAEKISIVKAENDAKLAEQRSNRLAIVTNYRDAVLANTGKGANDATKAAEQAATDAINNAMLERYAVATPKKDADTGAGTKGATTARIRAMYDTMAAAGKTTTEIVKDIIAAGESRGTTGAVVLAYEKELGKK